MNKDLDRLLSRRFSTMDEDGDGYLESCDFIDSICKLGHEFGHGGDSPQWRRLADLTRAWWEHLVRVSDSNADGRISEEEYKTAFYKGLLETPESFDAVYQPYLSAIMDIIDEDHDGRLTVEDEIRYARSLMRIPEAETREVFRRLDSDGDGFITKETLLEAIRAAYFDDSAESPRHWVLGPLDQPIELLNNNSGGGTVIPPPGKPEIEFHRRGWWGFELHCNDAALERIEEMRDKLFRRIGRFLPLKVRGIIHVWLKVRKVWLKRISRITNSIGVRLLSPWPIPILLTPLPLFPTDWGNPGTGRPPPLPPPLPTEDTGLRYSTCDTALHPNDQWSEEAMFPDGHNSTLSPALAEFRGRLYCVHVQQRDQTVHWNAYDPDSGWREERQPVTTLFSFVSPALVVFGDRLHCVVRGRDPDRPLVASAILFSMFDGNTWSAPTVIPVRDLQLAVFGNVSAPSAVVFRGQLYVFFRARPQGSDANSPFGLWFVRTTGNNQWTAPVRVRDIVSITGAGVGVHQDRLMCIYANNDRNVMHTWFDGTSWNTPIQVTGAQTEDDIAVVSREGQLHCLIRLMSNSRMLLFSLSRLAPPPPVNSGQWWPEFIPHSFMPHASTTGGGVAVYTDPNMLENCPDFDVSNRPRPQFMVVFRGGRL